MCSNYIELLTKMLYGIGLKNVELHNFFFLRPMVTRGTFIIFIQYVYFSMS